MLIAMCSLVSMLELLEFLTSVVIRMVAGPFDRRRIARFFETRGVSVRQIQWSPFSSGWLGNWHDRFYSVEYEAGNGDPRTTVCRTSWRTGVVVTDEDDLDAAIRDG